MLSAVCWALSVILSDYSIVDRLWSIIPVYYAVVIAFLDGGVRTTVAAVLISMWGIRLTYNFYRKGGYVIGHGEDYRWAEVRSWMSPFLFQVFNLIFIAVYQNILLAFLTLPLYVSQQSSTAFNLLDLLASVLILLCLIGETVADQQQWNFQVSKKKKKSSKGFLTSGLFRYSRHPNWFFEISIWWGVYLYSIAALGQVLNPSIIGAVLLTLLFQGSVWITEMLSLRKYPEYAVYQRETSKLIPWFPAIKKIIIKQ